jgi:hypothetical protein
MSFSGYQRNYYMHLMAEIVASVYPFGNFGQICSAILHGTELCVDLRSLLGNLETTYTNLH